MAVAVFKIEIADVKFRSRLDTGKRKDRCSALELVNELIKGQEKNIKRGAKIRILLGFSTHHWV